MLSFDVLIALILLATPILLASLPSLQADLKPVRVRKRVSASVRSQYRR